MDLRAAPSVKRPQRTCLNMSLRSMWRMIPNLTGEQKNRQRCADLRASSVSPCSVQIELLFFLFPRSLQVGARQNKWTIDIGIPHQKLRCVAPFCVCGVSGPFKGLVHRVCCGII